MMNEGRAVRFTIPDQDPVQQRPARVSMHPILVVFGILMTVAATVVITLIILLVLVHNRTENAPTSCVIDDTGALVCE